MIPAPSLIPELDDIVRRGDPARRADAARRISELFLQGAANFRSDHVELFDGVLTSLVPHAGPEARADLAERLSVLANAPRGLVGHLALEDEIAIAGPLLRRSPVIDEADAGRNRLRTRARVICWRCAERPTLSPDLTDVMIARGDRAVVRRTAGNAGAQLLCRRLFDADQARRPGRRADDQARPARGSFVRPVEGTAFRLYRCGSPPPVHRRHARAAGRHQAGDERDIGRHGTRGAPRLFGGAAHGAEAAAATAHSAKARCSTSPRSSNTRNRSPRFRR